MSGNELESRVTSGNEFEGMFVNELEFEQMLGYYTKLLRKGKIKSTDIVKKRLVKTVKYRGKNSNPNVASFKKRSNKPIIYKYDPKDYNGLPLVINTCGSPLIVYDPSSNYNYEITQDNNGYNISTYQYDGDKLFSNSRSAPVMIWNTRDKKIFESNITNEDSYNKDSDCRGSLNTLVDDYENAYFFRKGLRLFGGNNYALIGTNTRLFGSQIPEYKPFYFFFGDTNNGPILSFDIGGRKMSEIPEYIYGILIFSYLLIENLRVTAVVKNKILALILMRSADELQNSSEKYAQNVEKLVRDVIYNYYGFGLYYDYPYEVVGAD